MKPLKPHMEPIEYIQYIKDSIYGFEPMPALPSAVLCKNCGLMLAMHHSVNFADGPFAGKRFEICPTNVFEAKT